MRYELVIFDLDGTLLDTLADLADAVNRTLGEAGFPERSIEEIRAFIGNGVTRLIQRAAPPDTDKAIVERLLSRFRENYMENVNVRTRPFPGILDLLDALSAAGVRIAVNSNKPDVATQALCRAHFGGRIAMALGERPEIPRKPSPEGVRRIMETLKVHPSRALYVGDGDADLLTAQNAGIDVAWVQWGYRRREELGELAIPAAFKDAEALKRYILSW